MRSSTIVIPVYKESIGHNEMISLLQCFKILRKHKITLIAPRRLDVKLYNQIAAKNDIVLDVECFDDFYFADIKGYNNLMLSKEFYERFINFEYILIYQLDCFVFKDDFDYWCSLGYDYIGSPISTEPHLKGVQLVKKRLYNLKKRICYKFKKDKTIKYSHFEDTVINGGFSLRKIEKMIEVIISFQKNGKIDRFRDVSQSYLQEDIFFGFEAKSKLRIPSYKFAANFSVENFPIWYDFHSKSRPFGCHAWSKDYYIDNWIPVIQEWGYSVELES